MTTNTTNDVGRAFLRWLEAHAEEQPNPENFLSDQPTIDGMQITEAQLTKAVVRAEHLGMIKGAHAMGRDMPLRVRLLPPGQDCLDDFNGDMRWWDDAQKGNATVNNYGDVSITTGDNSNVAANSSRFSQNVTVNDPEGLHRLGVAAQELADLLDGKEDVAELRTAGAEVQRVATDLEKSTEAAVAGQRLQNALNILLATSASSTIVYYLIEAGNAVFGS